MKMRCENSIVVDRILRLCLNSDSRTFFADLFWSLYEIIERKREEHVNDYDYVLSVFLHKV